MIAPLAAGHTWPVAPIVVRRWLPGVVVAALLVASTALPGDAAWLPVLALVLLLGLPHGALDGEVARPLLRPHWGRWWFPVFALPYLVLVTLVLLAWQLAPLATLVAFLAGSALHFGHEDAPRAGPLERILRGALPIALPMLLQPTTTWHVLATVAQRPLGGLVTVLQVGAWCWAAIACVAITRLMREDRSATLVELAALTLTFTVLPPLTAFAAYFVLLHAPRHVAATVAHSRRAPRVRSTTDAVLRSLPLTVVTLAIGAVLWPLFPGPPPARLLSLTLQGLAALTLPHILLDAAAARAGR